MPAKNPITLVNFAKIIDVNIKELNIPAHLTDHLLSHIEADFLPVAKAIYQNKTIQEIDTLFQAAVPSITCYEYTPPAQAVTAPKKNYAQIRFLLLSYYLERPDANGLRQATVLNHFFQSSHPVLHTFSMCVAAGLIGDVSLIDKAIKLFFSMPTNQFKKASSLSQGSLAGRNDTITIAGSVIGIYGKTDSLQSWITRLNQFFSSDSDKVIAKCTLPWCLTDLLEAKEQIDLKEKLTYLFAQLKGLQDRAIYGEIYNQFFNIIAPLLDNTKKNLAMTFFLSVPLSPPSSQVFIKDKPYKIHSCLSYLLLKNPAYLQNFARSDASFLNTLLKDIVTNATDDTNTFISDVVEAMTNGSARFSDSKYGLFSGNAKKIPSSLRPLLSELLDQRSSFDESAPLLLGAQPSRQGYQTFK